MLLNKSMAIGLAVFSMSMTACLDSEAKKEQASTDSTVPAQKDSGCSATQLSTGARVDCGDTNATVNHGTNGANGTNGINGSAGTNGTNGTNGSNGINGTNGTNGSNGAMGPAGPTGPRGPAGVGAGMVMRLIDGDGAIVGDAVAGFEHSVSGTITTVFVSDMDGMISYYGGRVGWTVIAFESADCTGQAYTYVSSVPNEADYPAVKDMIYLHGTRAFKTTGLSSNRSLTNMHSYLDLEGVCSPGTNVFFGQNNTSNFIFQTANAITLTVPARLKPGFAVKFMN